MKDSNDTTPMSEEEDKDFSVGVKRQYPEKYVVHGVLDGTKDSLAEKVRNLFDVGEKSWDEANDAILLTESSNKEFSVASLCKKFDCRLRTLLGAYERVLLNQEKQDVFVINNREKRRYTDEEKEYILRGLFSDCLEDYIRRLKNEPNKILYWLYEKVKPPEHRKKMLNPRVKKYKDTSMKEIEVDFEVKKLKEKHEKIIAGIEEKYAQDKQEWRKILENAVMDSRLSLLRGIWSPTSYKELMTLVLTWDTTDDTLNFIEALTQVEMQKKQEDKTQG